MATIEKLTEDIARLEETKFLISADNLLSNLSNEISIYSQKNAVLDDELIKLGDENSSSRVKRDFLLLRIKELEEHKKKMQEVTNASNVNEWGANGFHEMLSNVEANHLLEVERLKKSIQSLQQKKAQVIQDIETLQSDIESKTNQGNLDYVTELLDLARASQANQIENFTAELGRLTAAKKSSEEAKLSVESEISQSAMAHESTKKALLENESALKDSIGQKKSGIEALKKNFSIDISVDGVEASVEGSIKEPMDL